MHFITHAFRLAFVIFCCLAVFCRLAEAANPRVEHVIHISVDGLRGGVIEELGPTRLPNLYRVRAQGAYTDNARTLFENTVTMPNHISMITGRPRDGQHGHNVTRNSDPTSGVRFVPGAVEISNQPGEFVRGSGALRIDDGSGPNYVRVNEDVLAGTPGSITSTVMGWYRYEDVDGDGSDTRNFMWESGPSDWPLSFAVRNDTGDNQKHAQWFTKNPSVGGSAASLPAVQPGEWHHAAVVIDEASENLKYYHDGVLVDEVTVRGLSLPVGAGTSNFFIGNHRAGDGSRNWDGFIDDLAVVNGLVTGTQIESIVAGSQSVPQVAGNNLVAHWTFDSDFSSGVNNVAYQGRPVVATAEGPTVHFDSSVAGGDEYVPSVFDAVHDRGLRTGFYAGWNGFNFIDASWNEASGAPDNVGEDNGTDKIDQYRLSTRDHIPTQTTEFLADMADDPHNYSLLHWHATDSRGHSSGWRSPAYLRAVEDVDAELGRLMEFVAADPNLAENTAIILTSDHGGLGTSHGNVADPSTFTVPFYVWVDGQEIGQELYTLNLATRSDPGSGRPDYDAPLQPIRNGDVANLALDLLGLGPLSGSTMNARQDLSIIATVPEPMSCVLWAIGALFCAAHLRGTSGAD